jgi:hypothetical protein
MLRKLSLSFAAVCLGAYGQTQTAAKVAPDPAPSAFDKATLEAYVRHMYVMDSRIGVKISDPKPDEMPGFSEVTVRASHGAQSQDIVFHISKDGKKIVQGAVFDIRHNPFQADLDKLKTEGAPGRAHREPRWPSSSSATSNAPTARKKPSCCTTTCFPLTPRR